LVWLCVSKPTNTLYIPIHIATPTNKESDIMGFGDKLRPKMGASGNKTADVEVAQAEAPHLEVVNWRKDPGLRKLYFYAFIICIASATTGYDG
jgi:hypothetical protein